jgi:hypothetical protein
MNTNIIAKLETLLERSLSDAEKDRLRRIGNVLGLGNNDVMWCITAAREYHRTFYDELPEKIASASTEILRGISIAAEAEARKAQNLLAESVVEQARKLSVRINMETLVPLFVLALVCLLAFGSLSMWAGFCLGTGQAQDMALILRMPSGLLMGALCLAGSLFLGVHTGREYAEAGKGWRKKGLVALAMLVIGGAALSLTL